MNDTHDKAAGFALIKQARALISGVNTALSESTRTQYSKAFSRMLERGSTPEKIANTARGFYYYRAAWVHHYASKMREILNSADRAQRAGDTEAWQESVSKLPELIQESDRYRPDPEGKNLAKGLIGKWAVEAEKRVSAGQKLIHNSKRVRLRGLPNDWRGRMFEGLRSGSKYQDVLAVLSATGARPAEFTQGIEVTLEAAGALHFKIEGVKTHGGKYGQAERGFSVSVDRPELVYLRDRLIQNNGPLIVKASAGALSDKVRQLSEKVFPNLKSTVSAYVFRHQLAADLKASGLLDTEVSAALGHSVDETKGYYGAAQSARSTGGIKNIRSSRKVRELTREKVKQLEHGRSKERERER
jgi:hypothetical protein